MNIFRHDNKKEDNQTEYQFRMHQHTKIEEEIKEVKTFQKRRKNKIQQRNLLKCKNNKKIQRKKNKVQTFELPNTTKKKKSEL